MRARRPWIVTARGGVVVAALVLAGCTGDDDSSDGTLDAIPSGSAGPVDSASVVGSVPAGTGAPSAAVGAGFVSIDVQVAAEGIAEALSLDRSTVAADALDAVTLDAICTPLDGGDPAAGVRVAVVDLARLASGARVVSAELRYADPAPGEHEMTLQVGGAEQVTTAYTGTVTVGADGLSGTFTGADAGGTPVNGSFACSPEAIVTTTTAIPADAGEEVPEDVGPPTS